MSELPSDRPAAVPGDDLAELLRPLQDLEERPVAEHVAAYESVHAGLRRVLAGEDDPQG
ncbi:hypothetical protein [Nocardioides aequoreus]|uniref:hypothetical protein n=1 Tax=Nocardioides aequoreus TaxID=397278 RepID=UPI0012F6594B|nr:hypothetical protein [Nocardioides aequoreus]